MSRSVVQRTAVVLGLLALSVFLFYIGRGHTLLIDTNAVTIDGKEMRSLPSVTISVDGQELEMPMGRAERSMLTVGGPRHSIVIVDDANPEKKVEKTFSVPTFMDMAVISVPAMLGNAPEQYWVLPFTPPALEDAPVEKMQYQAQ